MMHLFVLFQNSNDLADSPVFQTWIIDFFFVSGLLLPSRLNQYIFLIYLKVSTKWYKTPYSAVEPIKEESGELQV